MTRDGRGRLTATSQNGSRGSASACTVAKLGSALRHVSRPRPSATSAAARKPKYCSYYALFCSARKHLELSGHNFVGTGSIHRDVWGHLRESEDLRQRQLGVNGRRLHFWRKAADYDDSMPNVSLTTESAVSLARDSLDLLQDR